MSVASPEFFIATSQKLFIIFMGGVKLCLFTMNEKNCLAKYFCISHHCGRVFYYLLGHIGVLISCHFYMFIKNPNEKPVGIGNNSLP